MASELKVNTLTGVSTAGSIAVTAEGNSTTTNLQQGLAKAWGQYSGSGTTYADSFNLASATDNGTGDYTFTITNDMSNDDYAPSNIGGQNNIATHTFAAGSLRCTLANNSDAAADGILCLTFHGDLA